MYDDFGKKLTDSYGLFLFALMGRYHQTRAPGIEITPRAVVDLQRDARKLADTFYESAKTEINSYLASIYTESSGALLSVRGALMEAHVRSLLADNLTQANKLAKTGINNVATMLRGATGAVGMLAQRGLGRIDFKVIDTAGRRWDAEKLMLVLARDFAYQSYIDVAIQTYADQEVDLLELSDGRLLSIRGTEGYHSLQDVRRTVFHMNSKMMVTPYVQP